MQRGAQRTVDRSCGHQREGKAEDRPERCREQPHEQGVQDDAAGHREAEDANDRCDVEPPEIIQDSLPEHVGEWIHKTERDRRRHRQCEGGGGGIAPDRYHLGAGATSLEKRSTMAFLLSPAHWKS